MFGQQVERCRYVLGAYGQRQCAVAVNFTLALQHDCRATR